MQGRTAVLVNADDGRFSFPVAGSQFRLDSVKKQGYQMVDVEACTRTYKLSSNPFRKNLQKQLQEKEEEIEELKANSGTRKQRAAYQGYHLLLSI